MKESFCDVLLQFYPRISEYEDLHSTFIANCVFNNFLCYTAIILNILTIHAIMKTSSMPKTLKTLLLSLAVSDVGVGLFAQPMYTSLLVKALQQDDLDCYSFKVFNIITYFFALASFFGVTAVSVDRFLAIHLHLRYQELVTHKRVVAVVILIWVITALLSMLTLWVPLDIYSLIILMIGVLGLVLTTMVYIRIYLTVRRHRNQIQALEVQQEGQTNEMLNFTSLVKSTVGIFYVYLVFLVCYVPFLISFAALKIKGPSIALKRLFIMSPIPVYLNSSLNPVIYCWKMRHIRHAIMDTLRNISRLINHQSH
ncbi:melanocortin receptor 4-like [Oculina patagonica]